MHESISELLVAAKSVSDNAGLFFLIYYTEPINTLQACIHVAALYSELFLCFYQLCSVHLNEPKESNGNLCEQLFF